MAKESLTTWRKTKNIIDSVLEEGISNTIIKTEEVAGIINVKFQCNPRNIKKLTSKDRKFFISYLNRKYDISIKENDNVQEFYDGIQVSFNLDKRDNYEIKNLFKQLFRIEVNI